MTIKLLVFSKKTTYKIVNLSKEDVFSDTSFLLQSAFDGFNVCIFAYGQTGSGELTKTTVLRYLDKTK